MAKISNKEILDEASMSREMMYNAKKFIGSFGFDYDSYDKFLRHVLAAKNDGTVMLYPNAEMEIYRKKFIQKLEHSIADTMQIDKYKIYTSDNNGKQFETGFFCPRSFWDKIYNLKY